jgi:LAO/AO transport system kinase
MGEGDLSAGVLRGEKGAVARALNLVEDRRPGARALVASLLDALAEGTGETNGHRVGVTGPPGVGKSTLAAALARELRDRGRTVGVVAVDPSSIRSGGALLGDRARMSFDPKDEGLFIRSLATGGEAGGLSWAANAAVRVLGAAYDVVLIETTGVGQTETDVVDVADTVALVVQPASGDALQFLKAGIMEIPDVLVVNKADLGEVARRAATDLAAALLALDAAGATAAEIAIVETSATEGTGVADLVDAFEAHRAHLGDSGIREARRHGDFAWARARFVRRFGELGVETAGGRAALDAEITHRLAGGKGPLHVAEELGTEVLSKLRRG